MVMIVEADNVLCETHTRSKEEFFKLRKLYSMIYDLRVRKQFSIKHVKKDSKRLYCNDGE